MIHLLSLHSKVDRILILRIHVILIMLHLHRILHILHHIESKLWLILLILILAWHMLLLLIHLIWLIIVQIVHIYMWYYLILKR